VERIQTDEKKRELADALFAFCIRALSENGTREERESLPMCLNWWITL
jgi:hypothetical protein